MTDISADTSIPVMEQFHTLQGEGYHQGKAAYFIRLAGCDVGCHWCDVKKSWEARDDQWIGYDELLQPLSTIPPGICVITGGEPAMYDLGPLTAALKQRGWKTHIETSGAHPRSGDLDWICVSPKKFKPALDEWLAAADELKVVVFHPSDLAWAETFRERVGPGCHLYLQPEWDRANVVLPLMVEYVKQHPAWQISLQTHKYLGID